MIIEQEEFQKKLKRINLAYFSDPDRIITISRGNSVVRQGEQNKRLYLILSGSVVSYRHVVKEDPETASTSHKIYKAFRAGPIKVQGKCLPLPLMPRARNKRSTQLR